MSSPFSAAMPASRGTARVRAEGRLSMVPGTIDRIAVFRALMLGDMLCAVPAIRAIRLAVPRAQITLIGLPASAELAARLDCIDDFIAMPGYPGLPEIACDVRQLPAFFEVVQRRQFDLALQLHGSGGIVNPLVACFGARAMAGFHDGACWVPPADHERFTAWRQSGHEIERLLALTDHLDIPRQGVDLAFPLNDGDRIDARRLLGDGGGGAYVVVHVGAQLASRRWPLERFAQVARQLLARGLRVVLTGSAPESALTLEMAAQLGGRCLDLAGKTTLWTLGAVIERAQFMVCNDTGVSHIAAALGCPSVVVSCGADVARWAPLDRRRHRVLWHDLPCRPCAFAVCPHGHGCAHAISADDVLANLPAGKRSVHA